ncbi:hypothetical protein Vafri_5331 [Volvox africanus]|nr:hypothetical protein Vafri_5331 [Volvox africanus]
MLLWRRPEPRVSLQSDRPLSKHIFLVSDNNVDIRRKYPGRIFPPHAPEARRGTSFLQCDGPEWVSYHEPTLVDLLNDGTPSAASSLYFACEQWWRLQVESVQCLELLDEILAEVAGIDCMFLGPADMAVSMGLLGGSCAPATAATGGGGAPYTDLAAALAGPEMDRVHTRVLEACDRHGVAAGCFCVGPFRARQLADLGYNAVGFDVDTNIVLNAAAAAMQQLKS